MCQQPEPAAGPDVMCKTSNRLRMLNKSKDISSVAFKVEVMRATRVTQRVTVGFINGASSY